MYIYIYIYIYIHIHTYTYTCIHIYIYMYREREIEREREIAYCFREDPSCRRPSPRTRHRRWASGLRSSISQAFAKPSGWQSRSVANRAMKGKRLMNHAGDSMYVPHRIPGFAESKAKARQELMCGGTAQFCPLKPLCAENKCKPLALTYRGWRERRVVCSGLRSHWLGITNKLE